jgi:hypothetical protein
LTEYKEASKESVVLEDLRKDGKVEIHFMREGLILNLKSNSADILRWDILIKSKHFSLPGKKALLKSDTEFETILIDASESPIERPKKKNKK